jgi:hypothetical protein
VRRLYRVTGVWSDGTRQVRHYMTKKAAEHRAAVFRDGRAALVTYDHMNGPEDVVGPITPAVTVTVEASDPITWPES